MKKLRKLIAHLLDRSQFFCWANLVSFMRGWSYSELKNPSGNHCKKESIENGTCWCGKFQNGKLLTEADLPI